MNAATLLTLVVMVVVFGLAIPWVLHPIYNAYIRYIDWVCKVKNN